MMLTLAETLKKHKRELQCCYLVEFSRSLWVAACLHVCMLACLLLRQGLVV